MLRDVTMAVFLGAASHVSVASVAYAPNAPAIIPVPYVVDTNISYGQSWEDNTFDSFASPYNIPNFPTLLIAPHYTNAVGGNGPLPQSAGISLPGTIDGFTYNPAVNPFTIGLVGMSAQQFGGNLQMQGPASVLFAGEYLNAWAIQSDETVVAP